jgi:hypothetical protein
MSNELKQNGIIEAIKRGDRAAAPALISAGEGIDEYDDGPTLMVAEGDGCGDLRWSKAFAGSA